MADNETRPGTTTSAKPDMVLYPESRPGDEAYAHPDSDELEESLVPHMIRRPTEADFAEVLRPEGDSGDIVGSGISNSTTDSGASVGGTG